MILNECDLIVSVGARLGIRQVGRDASTFAPKADLVWVDNIILMRSGVISVG